MKAITKGLLLLQLVWICGCTSIKQIDSPKNEDIKQRVGKHVTFIGKTVNTKLGAALMLENEQLIWMDEMHSWPDGFYTGTAAKRVKVKGILIERHDLPVFIPNENDSITQQGIPMQKGTDFKKVSHRYVLETYKWNEIKAGYQSD